MDIIALISVPSRAILNFMENNKKDSNASLHAQLLFMEFRIPGHIF